MLAAPVCDDPRVNHTVDAASVRRLPLWAIALLLVVVDAVVLGIGWSLGILGLVVAVCVILWTQRKADQLWRERITTD